MDINALAGPAPWQKAALDLVVRWMQVTGSRENIPSNLAETLTQAPNLTVLASAGLTVVGTYEFTAPHIWTSRPWPVSPTPPPSFPGQPWATTSKPSSVTCETDSLPYSPTATSKNPSASCMTLPSSPSARVGADMALISNAQARYSALQICVPIMIGLFDPSSRLLMQVFLVP